MKKRSNDWLVGLAVIGTLVLIVASTLWLQEAQLGQQRMVITARFRDVGNMQVGNAVVIRGVRAGRVDQVALGENGWVTARLDLDEGIALPPDPVVLIQSSSLFGEWQATVTSREGAPAIREVRDQLNDAEGAPPQALPGAVLPDIAQLTTLAGGIAGNVASVAERVRTAFDDSAAKELRASIQNFSVLSADLARAVRAQSRNLDSVAVHVRAGAGDLSVAASTLSRTLARFDTATGSGEVGDIVEETRRAAVNIREASARLSAMSRSLETAEASLRGAVGKADSVLGRINRGEGSLGLLVNDPSLYHHSDSLLVDLRALIADVKRDPKRYFGIRIF